MKNKKPVPYVFLTLKEIIKTFNHDVPEEYQEEVKNTDYRKILLNNNACDDYLGKPNKNKPFIHKRYSLQDFYYDFLTHIGPMETKLFKEKKLENNHYLFTSMIDKLQVPTLAEQFNSIVTLIYAQGNIHPHWNRGDLLKKETIDEMIMKECLHGGINAFHSLSKIFSPEQFLNAVNLENKNYNLSECLILKAASYTLKNAQPLIDTVSCLSLIGQKIDYVKIKNDILKEVPYLSYFSIKEMNDSNINNIIVPKKFQANGEKYKLIDYVGDNYLFEQWKRCSDGKPAIGLNNETYSNFTDFKDYLINNDLWHNIEFKIIQNIANKFKLLTEDSKNNPENSQFIFKDLSKNINWCDVGFINENLLNQTTGCSYNKADGSIYEFSHLLKNQILAQSLFGIFKNHTLQKNLPFKNLDEGKNYLINTNELDNIYSIMLDESEQHKNDTKKAWRFLAMQLKIDNKNDNAVKKLKI